MELSTGRLEPSSQILEDPFRHPGGERRSRAQPHRKAGRVVEDDDANQEEVDPHQLDDLA